MTGAPDTESAGTAEGLPTATVIIATYSLDRWPQLVRSVESVLAQTHPPIEIIICVDHNDELLSKCRQRWVDPVARPTLKVIPNSRPLHRDADRVDVGRIRRYGGGDARNSGADVMTGEILVIIDDDAWADPEWLAELLPPYRDEAVVAVGGAPLPEYATSRPRWFPSNFDWVFGCVYEGLPTTLSATRRLIGANMSVRFSAFHALGGFQSTDFDDLDMCTRLAHAYPGHRIMFQPDAVVHHFVPPERTTWRYFRRRCYRVNRDKVEAFTAMGDAADLTAERSFVRTALQFHVARSVKAILSGDTWAAVQLCAMVVGIALAGSGHVVGRLRRNI